MRVGLFIPCYIDQFYPQVGIATLELLEKLGCEVVYPPEQTCCGQPMANSGFEHLTKGCNDLFIKNFESFDYVVSPSGSCVLHIKDHIHDPAGPKPPQAASSDRTDIDALPEFAKFPKANPGHNIPNKIYELVEFLTDVLKVEQ